MPLPQQFPVNTGPVVDPESGIATVAWQRFFQTLWERTGAALGSISTQLDELGSDPGDLAFRGPTSWQALDIGTAGQILSVAAGFPAWQNQATLLDTISASQGALLTRGVSTWGGIAISVANRVLTSTGTTPVWGQVTSAMFSTVSANAVLAGPTSGGAVTPSFRALVAGDLPSASTSTGLTATGASQATALALPSDWNVVATTPPGTGVILLAGSAGRGTRVFNQGANALLVYPVLGGSINALGVDNPLSLAAGAAVEFAAFSANLWFSI